MATTTNYGWATPDDTDLVKDGAAAIRTLGSSADTTVKNLNPETTTGDIAYRSATANVNTRLALGTAGQVLTVNAGATAPEWAAAAGGGKVLQVVSANNSTETSSSSSTFADTNLTATITPTSATSTILVLVNQTGLGKQTNDTQLHMRLLRGATVISNFERIAANNGANTNNFVGASSVAYVDSPATTSATTYKTEFASKNNNATVYVQGSSAGTASMSTIVLMEIGA